jgi:pyruvate dehydrogenase E1 component alpha subunit
MPGYSVDGNDVMDVYQTVSEAVERARDNGGPSFIECHTYRQCGHSRSDPAKYRPEGELDAWLAKDPIIRFRKQILEENLATDDQLNHLHAEIKAQIDTAAEQAAMAAWPEDVDLTEFTYVV